MGPSPLLEGLPDASDCSQASAMLEICRNELSAGSSVRSSRLHSMRLRLDSRSAVAASSASLLCVSASCAAYTDAYREVVCCGCCIAVGV
jgi:hypothetical protein